MRISELATASGLSLHRLRRYADAGLLLSRRDARGRRVFDAQAVRDARFIAMSREVGFSLASLADALPLYRSGRLGIDDMVRLLQARIQEVDTVIAEQQQLRARLVEHIGWFEQCRQKAAQKAARAAGAPSVFTRHKRSKPS